MNVMNKIPFIYSGFKDRPGMTAYQQALAFVEANGGEIIEREYLARMTNNASVIKLEHVPQPTDYETVEGLCKAKELVVVRYE